MGKIVVVRFFLCRVYKCKHWIFICVNEQILPER